MSEEHARDDPAPLEIHDLTVAYHKRPVLWGIDLEVPKGQPSNVSSKSLVNAYKYRDCNLLSTLPPRRKSPRRLLFVAGPLCSVLKGRPYL